MINWTHFIPGLGFYIAAGDTFEMVDEGEMTPVMGGAYLGTLAAVETIHAVHTGSSFAYAHVKRLQSAWWLATRSPQIAIATAPLVLAAANVSVIESAPVEQQRGMWMMFSSALTGTFGGDYSGLI